MHKPLTLPAFGLILVAQSVLVAAHIITGDSFWIDEFGTARLAEPTTLASWWQQFINWHDSDMQMPLYHAFMFAWAKSFGFSEYALRMANWPLFILAQTVFWWTFRRLPRFALMLLIVSVFHPLVWYYLNEARPYIMVYLGAVLTLCALARLYDQVHRLNTLDPFSPTLFSVGILILAASSMLGTPWVAAASLFAAYLHLTDRAVGASLSRKHWAAYAVLGGGLVLVAGFYLYTLLQGARATSAFESDLGTLLFSGYELMGLSGLGPGRLELRAEGVAALQGHLVAIFFGAVILAAGFCLGLGKLWGVIGARKLGAIALAVVLPTLLIAAAGFLMHWRVLGRHFMPLLPVVIALVALGASTMLASSRALGRLCAGLVIVTVGISGVSMGLPRHLKDDYRSAAGFALDALAAGRTVWWAAYDVGARYYAVPLTGTTRRPGEDCRAFPRQESAAAYYVSNLRVQCVGSLPPADVIILSKPDSFDTRGAITKWIAGSRLERTAELPAFSIWANSSEGSLRR